MISVLRYPGIGAVLDLECTYMPATAYIHDTGYGKNYLFALFQIKFRI